jgi:hypothetical protein
MRQMRIEDQQQCGTFLNDANPSVLVAVDAALVPFGLFKPALQIKIVWRQVCLFAPHKQSGSKARHDTTHMLPDGIVARLELLLQDLKLRLTLGTCITVWVEGRLDRPHILYVGSNRLLGVMDCRQTSRNVVC